VVGNHPIGTVLAKVGGNKLPAIPGKVAALGIFEEKGVTTTSVVIDEYQGRLSLAPNTARDADPRPNAGGQRKRPLRVDTLGRLWAVSVTAANVQDRDGAHPVVATGMSKSPALRTLYVEVDMLDSARRPLTR